jgi:hypothetical protein
MVVLAVMGMLAMLSYVLFSTAPSLREPQTQVSAQSVAATNTPVSFPTPTPVLTPIIVPTIFIPTRPAVTPPSVLPTIITPTFSYTRTVVPQIPPTIDVNQLSVVAEGSFKGWRIYENREHGFRIKIPPTFTIEFGQGFPERDLLLHVGFFDVKYKTSKPPYFPAIGLTVISNPNGLNLDTYFEEFRKPDVYGLPRYSSPSDICEVQIAGVRSLKFVHYPAGIQASTILVLLVNRSRIVEISRLFDPTIEATFDLMSQTFETMP